ncbi:MAG: hypothetical protein WAM42_13055, partial [Candidatus Nitrosopolaris sp.]
MHSLNERQLLVIYIFDFVVVIFLAIDFCMRLPASPLLSNFFFNISDYLLVYEIFKKGVMPLT